MLTWIKSMPEVFKIVILFIEFAGVYMNFLNKTCEMVLFSDK